MGNLELQNSLNEFKKYCPDWKLKVNVQKKPNPKMVLSKEPMLKG